MKAIINTTFFPGLFGVEKYRDIHFQKQMLRNTDSDAMPNPCLSLLLTLLFILTAAHAENTPTPLSHESFQGDFRTYYFNGDRDHRQDREALTIGGIFKYSTPSFNGFSGAVAFYTSHDMLNRGIAPTERILNGSSFTDTSDIGGNSELVQSNGDAIETLGEAYLQYTAGQTSFRIGRQRFDTPMLNDYYNRFLPSTFEAFRLTNNDMSDTLITAAVVDRWKYKTNESFKGVAEAIDGTDEKLYVLGIENNAMPSATFSGWFYRLDNAFNAFYTSFKHDHLLTLADQWKISGAFHYIKQDACGKQLIGKLDTFLAGIKLTLSESRFSWTIMTDWVGKDTLRGSGTDYSTLGFSKYVNFTDIQIDGEALNAGALSYGTTLQYRSSPLLNTAVKFVHIKQDDAAQLASTTPNMRPSSNEWNIDTTYKTDDFGKVQLQLAYIDYAKNPIITNEYDEVNLRIVYDYHFLLN